MASMFMGEIRLVAFNFAPQGWAQCNGQLLPINQNQALFSLLGTMYGGNGQTTFALPDMRARVPMHMGNGHTLGERAGENSHTVTISELPTHTHVLNGSSNAGTALLPANNLLAQSNNQFYQTNISSFTAMNATAVSTIGGSQPHENRQPFLALLFCIALQGIFPSQN
jgi:microcystin-dependent protein